MTSLKAFSTLLAKTSFPVITITTFFLWKKSQVEVMTGRLSGSAKVETHPKEKSIPAW
jgi:hypothetical protein